MSSQINDAKFDIMKHQDKGVKEIRSLMNSANKLTNKTLENGFEDVSREVHESARKSEQENRMLMEELQKMNKRLFQLSVKDSKDDGPTPVDIPFAVTTSRTSSSINEISECSQKSRISININPPSILSDDDDANKENTNLHTNNILRQENAELKEMLAAEKQAKDSIAAEKKQVVERLQTVISPTRKRPENVIPTLSRQTAREKRAETRSINNSKTGRVKKLQGQSCLHSERDPKSKPPRRETRSQSRLAEQG